MKRASPWRPPEPSLFRKTPPEILALNDRRQQAARSLARRRQAFQATVNGVVLTSAVTSAVSLVIAVAVCWR